MTGNFRFLFLTVLALASSGCATVSRKPALIHAPGQAQGIYHVVTSGQTLWRIAKIYDVSVKDLMRLNGIVDPGQLAVGRRLVIPEAAGALPAAPFAGPVIRDAENIVGYKHLSSHWRTITIHHSGTLEGNAAAFDRHHRKRGMGGLFYHFVIGNGACSRDGEIEVGWRWKKQAQVNRRNDIQICLVGDFNRQRVSDIQFDSLVKLIAVLRRQYNIPVKNIRKHKSIKGKHTACPGRNFPFQRLISLLGKVPA